MSAPMAAQTYEEGLKLRQRLFAKLRETGYHPVPIVDGEKNPLTLKWPELARANDPSLTLETGQSGIGLECTGLRIVDIDIEEPELAARVTALTLKMLGPAPRRFRDNAARVAFLYKAATGEPRKRFVKRDLQKDSPKVEILGAGCQVFAFGKHPSGADLRWSGLGYARGIIPRDDLPSVTELQITEYLTEVGVMIGATTSPKAPTSCSSATSGDLKACDINALAEIVSQIPNDARYDDRNAWVTFAHAIAAAFADDLSLGRDLWLKFCNRRKIPQVEGAPEKVWDTLGTTHVSISVE